MAVRRGDGSDGQPNPQRSDRHVSVASQLYWRVMDTRRTPTSSRRRRDVLELIHRITGATVTSLYSGTSSPQLVDQVGEPVVDVKHDDRARTALSSRRMVTLDAGDRCELPHGTVFSGGIWRPLDLQGITVGLVRLLARAPLVFHPGTVTLLDFMAAWLASSLVADGRPSVWVDPALDGQRDDAFDGDLDDVARLVVESGDAPTGPAVERAQAAGEPRGSGRMTLAV